MSSTTNPQYTVDSDGNISIERTMSKFSKHGVWFVFGLPLLACLGLQNAFLSLMWIPVTVAWIISNIIDEAKTRKHKRKVQEILWYKNYGMEDVE